MVIHTPHSDCNPKTCNRYTKSRNPQTKNSHQIHKRRKQVKRTVGKMVIIRMMAKMKEGRAGGVGFFLIEWEGFTEEKSS